MGSGHRMYHGSLRDRRSFRRKSRPEKNWIGAETIQTRRKQLKKVSHGCPHAGGGIRAGKPGDHPGALGDQVRGAPVPAGGSPVMQGAITAMGASCLRDRQPAHSRQSPRGSSAGGSTPIRRVTGTAGRADQTCGLKQEKRDNRDAPPQDDPAGPFLFPEGFPAFASGDCLPPLPEVKLAKGRVICYTIFIYFAIWEEAPGCRNRI